MAWLHAARSLLAAAGAPFGSAAVARSKIGPAIHIGAGREMQRGWRADSPWRCVHLIYVGNWTLYTCTLPLSALGHSEGPVLYSPLSAKKIGSHHENYSSHVFDMGVAYAV